MGAEAFIDSNVVLYLLSGDATRADRAERVLERGAVISVQVLNEVANVARRKLRLKWAAIDELLAALRAICKVEPLTLATHDTGRRIAERYGLSVWDALTVASALLAGCGVLYSEDMQHGLLVERKLRIHNPFTAEIR